VLSHTSRCTIDLLPLIAVVARLTSSYYGRNNIETTRKHYDYFETGRIVGRMDLGFEGGNVPLGPKVKEKIAPLSLQ
jgi:hypothetical protein